MIKNIRALKEIISKLIILMNRRQRWQSVILIITLLISAVLEMFGIGVIIPMLMAVLQPDKLMDYEIVHRCFKMLGVEPTRNNIILMISGIVIVIYVIKNLFAILVSYYQFRFNNQFFRDLSIHVMKNYMKRPYSFFLGINSSEILRGIETDTSNIALMVADVCELISIGFIVTVISAFLIWLDPVLTLVLLLSIACASFAIIMIIKTKIHIWGEGQRETVKRKNQCAYQMITGIKDITVMNRRKSFMKDFVDAANINCKCQVNYDFMQYLPMRSLETVFIIVLIAILLYCSFTMNDITMFMAKLSAVALASMRILPQLSFISININALIFRNPSLKAIYQEIMETNIIEEKSKIEEPVVVREKWKKLYIKEISWKYEENEKKIINDLSLVIKRGESVAFIGESGAGKTTLVDIILGLLRPVEGSISLDDIDISSIPTQWATIVGYVPQTIFLIDGTIRDNIIFGADVDNEKRMWEVIEKAQLKEYVGSLPKGIDTMVGERGVKLSGGQRQRIAIARALYYNPEILILDEATAALDNETENAVMEAINTLQGEKTLIVIAHRLSTIKNFDSIYEIKSGQVIPKPKGTLN